MSKNEIQINIGKTITRQQFLTVLNCYLEQYYNGDWLDAYKQILSFIDNGGKLNTEQDLDKIYSRTPDISNTANISNTVNTKTTSLEEVHNKEIIEGVDNIMENKGEDDMKEQFDNNSEYNEKPKPDVFILDEEEEFDNATLTSPTQELDEFESIKNEVNEQFDDPVENDFGEDEEIDEFGDVKKKSAAPPKKKSYLDENTSANDIMDWEGL